MGQPEGDETTVDRLRAEHVGRTVSFVSVYDDDGRPLELFAGTLLEVEQTDDGTRLVIRDGSRADVTAEVELDGDTEVWVGGS